MEQIKRIDNTTIEIDGVLYKAEETTKQGNLDEVERLVLEYVRKNKLGYYISNEGIIGNSSKRTHNHSTENHTKARRLKMLWEMLAKVLNEGELDWSNENKINKYYVYTSNCKILISYSRIIKQEGATYFKEDVIDKAISLFGEDNLLFMIENS
jgi:hypothetical protein